MEICSLEWIQLLLLCWLQKHHFSIGNPVVNHSGALSPVYLLFPLANEISDKNPVEGGVSWRGEDLVSVHCSHWLFDYAYITERAKLQLTNEWARSLEILEAADLLQVFLPYSNHDLAIRIYSYSSCLYVHIIEHVECWINP